MPGTLVLVHHDIAVVVDPDVLVRRDVSERLKPLGIHALAFGSGHDAARQLLRMAPKLRAMPLPEQSADLDLIAALGRRQNEAIFAQLIRHFLHGGGAVFAGKC